METRKDGFWQRRSSVVAGRANSDNHSSGVVLAPLNTIASPEGSQDESVSERACRPEDQVEITGGKTEILRAV
jgi:hypothetical protein